MTLAHRVKVPIGPDGRVEVVVPAEMSNAEAEVIVLVDRRASFPAGGRFVRSMDMGQWLERAAALGRGTPEVPLAAFDRGDLYDRDTE